ncbi:MAG: M28 family peptidase [Bacteroidales bacterium]
MRAKRAKVIPLVIAVLAVLAEAAPAAAQAKGASAIRAEDMKFHMQFLGAPEFKGRNMPSTELEIASRYIALAAQRIGLAPLLADGSYFQDMPLEVARIADLSRIGVTAAGVVTQLPVSMFGVRGRSVSGGVASGGVVLLGLGANAPALGWDDFAGLDLKGKVVVILDAPLPASHALRQPDNRALVSARVTLARQKGAVAVLTVVSKEREAALVKAGVPFLNLDRGRALDIQTTTSPASQATAAAPPSALFSIDLRHDAACALLGTTRAELAQMFDTIGHGQRVTPRDMPERVVDVTVNVDTRRAAARNVVAWIEGSDPVLKNEYIVLGSHHDGIGYREDAVFPGADDNISGVVAMFSIGKALMIERPKRSVVFVWHTGEEKGLLGAYYFVQHSPVPVEKISANLNMDMLCRNDPNSIYLIGSNKVSTELDAAINETNRKFTKLNLDYKYQEPTHPDRFFFRSDQYPYIRYGIPGVWFFCGTTDDYHQPTDLEERVDYAKMERVTKLVYYTAMAIGNRPGMLKLDVNPRITARGKHNMQIDWQAAPQRTQSSADSRGIR